MQLRRRREPVAERPESVVELHLEAPSLEAVIVGREIRERRPPELRKRCSLVPSRTPPSSRATGRESFNSSMIDISVSEIIMFATQR